MATIKISDLHSAGSELFIDSESYLNELTNEELNTAHGGITSLLPTTLHPTYIPANTTLLLSITRRP